MMSRLLAALPVLAAPAFALALEGRLVDPAGDPLAGARVAVVGSGAAALSDPSGRFVLPGVVPPCQLLVTGRDGVAYAPAVVPDGAGEPVVVRLEAALAASLTVVAGVVPGAATPPAVAVTIVGRRELAELAPERLADALEAVPGTGRLEEGASVVPSVRGLARGRTLLLVDGGRVTAERRAGPSATFLDPETLEAVEVRRGPGAVAYGSDALGGVILARSRWAGPDQAPELRASLGIRSPGRGRSGSVEAGGGWLGGGLLAGAQFRDAGDAESPRGPILDSGARDAGLRLGYQRAALGGWLRVGLRSDLGRDIGKPDRRAPAVRAWYPEESSHRLTVALERPGPAGFERLSVEGFLDDYRLVLVRSQQAAEGREVGETDVRAGDYGLRLQVERPAGPGRVFAGIDLNGRFGLRAVGSSHLETASGERIPTGREVSVGDARRDDAGLYAGADVERGRLGLAAALRLDHVRTRNRGGWLGDRSTGRGAASGFAAATVDLGGGTGASLQVARGFRDPTLSDRYFRGVSGRGFVTGNPDLDSETSLQWDAALRHARAATSIALFAYRYRIDDLVERTRTGDDFFFRNAGGARLEGIELEVVRRLGGGLELGLAGHLERGRRLPDGAALDDVPPAGVAATLRGGPWGRLRGLVRLQAAAAGDSPGPTEVETPSHATIDAAGTVSLGSGVSLQLHGWNLTDAAYPGTPDENAVLAPGRRFGAVLRLSR